MNHLEAILDALQTNLITTLETRLKTAQQEAYISTNETERLKRICEQMINALYIAQYILKPDIGGAPKCSSDWKSAEKMVDEAIASYLQQPSLDPILGK